MSRGDSRLPLAWFLALKDVGWQSYRTHCSDVLLDPNRKH